MDEGFRLSPEMAAGALLYGAVVVALGACATRTLLVARLARIEPAQAADLERAAARVGLTASLVAVAALGLRAWTHTVTAFGLADSLAWDNLRTIAIDSRWGQNWTRQGMAGIAAATALWLARRRVPGGWTIAAAGVIGLTATLPLIGHAAGSPLRVTIHGAHLVGSGLWLGTLTVLRASVQQASIDGAAIARFRLFAGVAGAGVGMIAISGLLASSIYVGSPAQLASSLYGRTLVLKLACVAGAVVCGALNWRDLHRAHTASPATVIRRVTVELAFGTAAVAVTGALAELPHP